MPQRRTPAPLKALRGEKPKRLRLPGVPEFELDPPEWLSGAGLVEWERVAEISRRRPGWLTALDRAALVAYCQNWSVFDAASADVAARGPVVAGRSDRDGDRMVRNPSVQIARDAQVALRNWARELGMTPVSRSQVDRGGSAPLPGSDLLTGGDDPRDFLTGG